MRSGGRLQRRINRRARAGQTSVGHTSIWSWRTAALSRLRGAFRHSPAAAAPAEAAALQENATSRSLRHRVQRRKSRNSSSHEPGQPLAIAQARGVSAEGFEVVAHDMVERARRRVARPVCVGRTAHAARDSSAGPHPKRLEMNGNPSGAHSPPANSARACFRGGGYFCQPSEPGETPNSIDGLGASTRPQRCDLRGRWNRVVERSSPAMLPRGADLARLVYSDAASSVDRVWLSRGVTCDDGRAVVPGRHAPQLQHSHFRVRRCYSARRRCSGGGPR